MTSNIAQHLTLAEARNHFPGTRKCIYFETSAWGLVPAEAKSEIIHCLDLQIDGEFDKDRANENVERVRAKFAKLIKAKTDEIAIIKNVSEGVNAIVASILWNPGDNVVVCADVDHPNCVYALYNVRDRYGVQVKNVPSIDFRLPEDEIISAIDKRTRLVIAPSVPFSTGIRTDLQRIGKACREQGVLFFVDGAQSVGALDMDVNTHSIDALAVATSKYLCAPHGLGFLYVRSELAEKIQPAYLARYSVDLGSLHEGDAGGEHYRLKNAAGRFDIGSYNYLTARAVEKSLDLLLACGSQVIEEHVLHLSHRFASKLSEMGFYLLAGPPSPLLSQVVLVGGNERDGTASDMLNLHQYLTSNKVKVSLRRGRLRCSFHFYNTEQEVDNSISLIETWHKTYSSLQK